MNLLKETLEILRAHDKTLADVEYIIANGHEITVGNFVDIARDFEYWDGYGHQEVPEDLKIVGQDWWMERYEYDGSEWWNFLRKPDRPSECKHLFAILGCNYDSEKYVYEKGGEK